MLVGLSIIKRQNGWGGGLRVPEVKGGRQEGDGSRGGGCGGGGGLRSWRP